MAYTNAFLLLQKQYKNRNFAIETNNDKNLYHYEKIAFDKEISGLSRISRKTRLTRMSRISRKKLRFSFLNLGKIL